MEGSEDFLTRQVDSLVVQLQPHPRAEAHRYAVFQHVCKMIQHVAQEHVIEGEDSVLVFRFGSVPLKTYLPHGDLDLTAFAADDRWLQKLKDKLEADSRDENVPVVVYGVHSVPHDLSKPAHAEVVKVVKCQVGGIAVDVSANAVGGMCTLCLLEKVDTLVGRDHLFKRAMVLVKAWCYFESHILSSQNGLLATYALETMVLCIINLFYKELSTAFQVLSKFLEYFANFDWDQHCLTIRGPVKKENVKEEMVVEPDNDPGFLLCDDVLQNNEDIKVLLSGLKDDNRGFQWKHMNICDPLSVRNNLGRSVSLGNLYRIRRCFLKGWSSLQEIRTKPGESGMHSFFRHTVITLAGHRPDVGEMCITADFNNRGTSTLSSRSTDPGHSGGSVSTMSRSSGDNVSESGLTDDDKTEKSGNTALNTFLNTVLTKESMTPAEGVVPKPGLKGQGHFYRRSDSPTASSNTSPGQVNYTEAGKELESGAHSATQPLTPSRNSDHSESGGNRGSSTDGERECLRGDGDGGKSQADTSLCADALESVSDIADDCDSDNGEDSASRPATWGSVTEDILGSDIHELMGDLQRARRALERLQAMGQQAIGVARSLPQPPLPPANKGARGHGPGRGPKGPGEVDLTDSVENFPPLG